MYFEELVKRISPTLKRITHKLNGHFSFFNDEDLFQEALVHLWGNFEGGKLSDKTDSYILQGCYFHLKNYLRTARDKTTLISLDAFINEDDGATLDKILIANGSASMTHGAHSKMSIEGLDKNGLSERERLVLSLSLEGLTVREMGRKLGVSHVMVVKIRKNLCRKLASS